MPQPIVITVGMHGLELHKEVVSALRAQGIDIDDLTTPEELPKALPRNRNAVVVVYSRQRGNGAHEVLLQLSALYRSIPVIVLVEQSDFGEYQELMADGALCYYELSEEPERICSAVTQVAKNAA